MAFSIVKEKLEKLQQRLLKLTTSNQLLNTNFQSRGLDRFRIIDELPDELYSLLVNDKVMRFDPLPLLGDDPRDEQKPQFKKLLEDLRLTDVDFLRKIDQIEREDVDDLNQATEDAERGLKNKVRKALNMKPLENLRASDLKAHAIENNILPDFSLPSSDSSSTTSPSKWTDNKIQTLLLPDRLKRYERAIHRKVISIRKETGVNPLYMAFGFLEWKEHDSSDKRLRSPLLLLSVEFKEIKRGQNVSGIKSAGESLEVNETLHEKLFKDFRIELPKLHEINDEESIQSIEDYWKEVQESIKNQKSWTLKRYISFGSYTDQNMAIFKDLGHLIESEIPEHLEKILSGIKTGSSEVSQENYDVDELEKEGSAPALIEPADASQHSAVLDVIDGKNLVIKGPPGTGKSQTITNIITSMLSSGKKVLFVAQKQAALDVVRNNLQKNGYEDYLLEVFSSKANRAQVFESIKKRVEKERPPGSQLYQDRLENFRKTKESLNEYAKLIGTRFGNSGKTIHEIFWDIPNLAYEIPSELLNYNIGIPKDITESDLLSAEQDLKYLADNMLSFEHGNMNAIENIELIKTIFTNPFALEDFLGKLREISKKILQQKKDKNTYFSTFPPLLSCQDSFQEQISILQELSTEYKENLDLVRFYFSPDLEKFLNELNSVIVEQETYRNSFTEFLNLDFENNNELQEFYFSIDVNSRYSDWLNIAKSLSTEQKEYLEKRSSVAACLQISSSVYSENDYREAAKTLRLTSLFSFFSSDWHKAKALFADIWIGEKKPAYQDQGKKLTALYEILSNDKSRQNEIDKELENLKSEIVDLSHLCADQAASFEKKLIRLEELFSKENLNLKSAKEILNGKTLDLISKIYVRLSTLNQASKSQFQSNPELIQTYISFTQSQLLINSDVNKCLSILGVSENVFDTLDKAGEFLLDINENPATLQTYMSYRVNVANQEKTTTGKFFKACKKAGIPTLGLEQVYRSVVRKSQQREIWDEHGSRLNHFTGETLKKLQTDLKRLDRALRTDTKAEQERLIWDSSDLYSAPMGVSSGRVSEKTEKGLIDHICNKPNSRVPLRQLFEKAGDTIAKLKPCFLMSPITVSQMLPLRALFDVIIIDEASQLQPELAIPSIARATQAVIVGDPHQLPPSNNRWGSNRPDEHNDDFNDESILDMALTTLSPARELLWHYRSRHEDLIKFSNQEFYNNLMIPVTADPNGKNRGISYHFVEKGIYQSRSQTSKEQGGINVIERDAIVEEIINFMKSRPDESLGVVTMNQEQTKIIEYEYNRALERNREVADYAEKWAAKDGGIHEFFIKSLENVQGDERDVMIIGTLYGPNSEGKVHQRFHISGAHGRRRLNVLITRAKHEVKLFSSLPISKLENTEDPARSTFKKYLEFAKRKILPEGKISEHGVDNAFQQWAIDQVNSFPGFSADWEIGVRGYRIDIAVKHENFGNWIMAVETDGATYHSSIAARDRDLLRQEILEGYGWVFHRIWSTDWLTDPVRVRQTLKSALEARVAQLEAKQEAQQDHVKDIDKINSEQSTTSESQTDQAEENEQESHEFVSQTYIIGDISDVITVDHHDFYQSGYRIKLSKAITHLVECEGPIEFDTLIRRVREAHGFAKAGVPIRNAILKAIDKKISQTEFEGKVFFWPETEKPTTWHRARYPSSYSDENDKRKFDEVSPEEIVAIDMYQNHEKNLVPSERAKEVSKFLGWQKCSTKASNYIKNAFDKAKNKDFF